MGRLTIKMIREFYKSDSDIENLIKYIAAQGTNMYKEKLLCCKGRGVSSNVKKVSDQMIAVQKAFGKNNKRRIYHLIVSFPPDLHDKKLIKKAADEIASMLYEDYQVFYGIHTSKSSWHIHYAINAVSYKTGRKWHKSRDELEIMKEKIEEIVYGESGKNN